MKHLKSALMAVSLLLGSGLQVCAQSFYIGDYKAIHDSYYNMWLCSIPQELFGTSWVSNVQMDSLWSEVRINGIEVADGDTVTFDDIAGDRNYPITATIDGQHVEGVISFTWLPLLELEGNFGNDYTNGLVTVNTNDGSHASALPAKLKWRGHSTNTAGKHKRNYHIKFIDENGDKKDQSFFGLRKDNHWKLDAGQADLLRIRNRVCSELWLDMSVKPWYQDLEPKVINGSRGEVTELILNGEYRGIYSLIEPVDRKQLKLVKHDTTNNVFHGQAWKVENWCRTASMSAPVAFNNNSETWDGFELVYPDIEDVSPTKWETLHRSIMFVNRMDATDNWVAFADSLEYYFDMPVMVDYFILLNIMLGLDNETKNIYYSCYDNDMGELPLVMTPWDMDISFGSYGSSSITADKVRPNRPFDWCSNVAMYDMFFCTNKYRNMAIKRYWKLRKTFLDPDSLVGRFRHAVDVLELSGAASREEGRWSKDSDIQGMKLDISNEMAYVENWIRQRIDYLDNNFFPRPEPLYGDVNGDESVSIADVTALIDYLLGGNAEIDEINSDVDTDGQISISDVTALIDLLLRL